MASVLETQSTALFGVSLWRESTVLPTAIHLFSN